MAFLRLNQEWLNASYAPVRDGFVIKYVVKADYLRVNADANWADRYPSMGISLGGGSRKPPRQYWGANSIYISRVNSSPRG